MGSSQSKKVTAQGTSRLAKRPLVDVQRLTTDRAILDLKLQRDKLHIYSRRIQTVLAREKELAKEALAQDQKQKALLILRRRKYQEQVLLKADAQLETLEQLVRPTY
jgi:hypothetical protein